MQKSLTCRSIKWRLSSDLAEEYITCFFRLLQSLYGGSSAGMFEDLNINFIFDDAARSTKPKAGKL